MLKSNKKNTYLYFWETPEDRLQCKGCKEMLPVQRFYIHQVSATGRNVLCIDCEHKQGAEARVKRKKKNIRKKEMRKYAIEYNKQLKEKLQEAKDEMERQKRAEIDEYKRNKVAIDKKVIKDFHNILKSITSSYPILNHEIFDSLKK
jgi:hypothetical protein